MIWLLILLLLLSNDVFADDWTHDSSCKKTLSSNKGSEFIIAFSRLWVESARADLKLFASSNKNVSIDIDSPLQGFSHMNTATSNGTIPIVLDSIFEMVGTGIGHKSVLVKSSSAISLYGLRDNLDYLSEAFLALPTESLSTVYVVASYTTSKSEWKSISQLCIAGLENGTLVSIKLKTTGIIMYENNNYRNGDSIHLNLSRLETFSLEHTEDISGTIVSGSKPIAVFSGGIASIPDRTSEIDKMASQLVPVEHWDTEYIVPPLYPRKDSIIRIYSFFPNTSISVGTETSFSTSHLATTGFFERVLGREPVLINSSKPVSVVQYAFSNDHDVSDGDPLMIIIPGINQFSSEYMLLLQTNAVFKHYVAIIIRSNLFSGLWLNGHFNADVSFHTHFNGNDYIVAITRIPNTFHILSHADTAVKFGALVYGFSYKRGYGFPAGMEFTKTISCATERSITPVTSVPAHGMQTACFSCTGMTHLKHCSVVENCPENLGCFVEKYYVGSHLRYNSGCVMSYSELCQTNNNVLGRCTRCCNTSYCNSHGCGDDGFGNSTLRGPLCYECQHLDTASDCIDITECVIGELCFIDENVWGANEKVYTMGCRPKYHCHSPTSPHNRDFAVFERTITTCSQCCEGDFCNTNCTTPLLTPIIGTRDEISNILHKNEMEMFQYTNRKTNLTFVSLNKRCNNNVDSSEIMLTG